MANTEAVFAESPLALQVTVQRKYLLAEIPVKPYVANVAPVILVQVALSGEDCHWKPTPPATEYPVQVRVNTVALLPVVGDTAAVPAVGVPEHILAPVPETGTLMVVKPPPDIVIFVPEYVVAAVGLNWAYIVVAANVLAV